jgi:hypothetical protein
MFHDTLGQCVLFKLNAACHQQVSILLIENGLGSWHIFNNRIIDDKSLYIDEPTLMHFRVIFHLEINL